MARTLELQITEDDGHVTIRCTHVSCVWTWRLEGNDDDGALRRNGGTISRAVRHAMTKNHDR